MIFLLYFCTPPSSLSLNPPFTPVLLKLVWVGPTLMHFHTTVVQIKEELFQFKEYQMSLRGGEALGAFR